MALTYITRDSLPVIGLLWNPRLLPFLYITRLLLMMVGIVELVHYVVRNWQGVTPAEPAHGVDRRGGHRRAPSASPSSSSSCSSSARCPAGTTTTKNGKSVYAWGIDGWDPITLTPTSQDAVADGWTRYNFEGYEGRPAYGGVQGADRHDGRASAPDPPFGCGRAIWENNEATGAYGTTMALMLLPHWTDGCIDSMEGLFFEASGTTPYHFLTASAISTQSSDPVRELRYDDSDTAKGVPYMQSLGVRYLMVFTQEAKDQADALPPGRDPQLTHRGRERAVEDLPGRRQPARRGPGHPAGRRQPARRRPARAPPGDWARAGSRTATSGRRCPPTAVRRTGSASTWSRMRRATTARTPGEPGHKVDVVIPDEPIDPVTLPQVTVSNIQLGDQDISFDVDQIGVPTLVKVSYFPNWQVEGAEGPWRIGPNMMVVVPTSNHVRLYFARSTLDYVAYGLTLLGIVLLVVFRFRGDVRACAARARSIGRRRSRSAVAPTAAADDARCSAGRAHRRLAVAGPPTRRRRR